MSVGAPSVIKWYRLYAGLLAALYVLCFLVTLVGFFIQPGDIDLQGYPPAVFRVFVTLFAVLCAALAGLFIYSFLLGNTPNAWIYHLVLICIGMTSPCCMLASIPLLIFWLKPETQVYFGRRQTPVSAG